IENITEEDLQALIENSVLESKTLEYKQELPKNSDQKNSDQSRKEFLADVSSFANASGGDLIFGITEGITEGRKTGIPKSLEGLSIENIDQEILRLENMIRAGIEPRIPPVSTQPITLKNSKTVLVIRIPKSWRSPHRVSYKGHDKFYSRSSNGKYPLDVPELRVAFNLSETVTERIRNFRLDRISNIVANETPVPFYDTAKIVLHLIPIISFNPAQSYDIDKVASQPAKMPPIPPIHCKEWNNRYNLDGVLTYSVGQEGKSYSYVQLFRNGIIEAVEGLLLEPHHKGERLLIPSTNYEKELVSSLTDYLSILKTLNVEPPIFIFLTLLGVKGYSMGVSRDEHNIDEVHTIDRDTLPLPEVIIESYDVIPEKVLKPCFDSIWNACGYKGSFNYDDAGEWNPKH
ncbi:MAG: ATP-binding protein, partial [Dehalococcoidales bacterium]|nr:ATP-binding protein [Dehalococcoidales bacterium]